ncbi:MAG: hypothetical protein PVJ57_06145 [Phycisphaerae bacterium]
MPSFLAWSLAVALSLIFLASAVTNLIVFYHIRFRREYHSFLGIVGGIAGMLAILIVPLPGVRPYWCVPLFADIGTTPLLIVTLIYYICRAVESRREEQGPENPESGPHTGESP